MDYKGRPKSTNIEDRRRERKVRRDPLRSTTEREIGKYAKGPPGYELGPFKSETLLPRKPKSRAERLYKSTTGRKVHKRELDKRG